MKWEEYAGGLKEEERVILSSGKPKLLGEHSRIAGQY